MVLNGFKLGLMLVGIVGMMSPDGLAMAMAIEPMLVGLPRASPPDGARAEPQDNQQMALDLMIAVSNGEDGSMVTMPMSKWRVLLEALQNEGTVKRLALEHLNKLNQLRAANAEEVRSGAGGDKTVGPMAEKKDGGNIDPEVKIKYLGVKKNTQFRKQFMSPCHFKVCNLGRKRNSE